MKVDVDLSIIAFLFALFEVGERGRAEGERGTEVGERGGEET